MSQTGKLYKFYFRKIWQKNWLRIIIFTLLIGIVWWFVIPWTGSKILVKTFGESGKNLNEEQRKKKEEEESFSELARLSFGGKTKKGVELDLW
jgi:hypothetical protein